MPAITVLTFSAPLNTSCQIGDTAYYMDSTATLGSFTTGAHNNIIEIGIITAIGGSTSAPTITIGNSLIASVPNGSFILFTKNNKANLSSLLGYYAEVRMVNSDTGTLELFSVGVDTFESSK